jgi:hypothetical protein
MHHDSAVEEKHRGVGGIIRGIKEQRGNKVNDQKFN